MKLPATTSERKAGSRNAIRNASSGSLVPKNRAMTITFAAPASLAAEVSAPTVAALPQTRSALSPSRLSASVSDPRALASGLIIRGASTHKKDRAANPRGTV